MYGRVCDVCARSKYASDGVPALPPEYQDCCESADRRRRCILFAYVAEGMLANMHHLRRMNSCRPFHIQYWDVTCVSKSARVSGFRLDEFLYRHVHAPNIHMSMQKGVLSLEKEAVWNPRCALGHFLRLSAGRSHPNKMRVSHLTTRVGCLGQAVIFQVNMHDVQKIQRMTYLPW